jgi:hypothetical protein
MPDKFGRLTQKELDQIKIMQEDLGATPEPVQPMSRPNPLVYNPTTGEMVNLPTGTRLNPTSQDHFPKLKERIPASVEPTVDENALRREIENAEVSNEEDPMKRAIRDRGY